MHTRMPTGTCTHHHQTAAGGGGGELNSQFYKPRTAWPHPIGPAKRGGRGRGSEGSPGNEMVGCECGCPGWGWDFHQAGAKRPVPHVEHPDHARVLVPIATHLSPELPGNRKPWDTQRTTPPPPASPAPALRFAVKGLLGRVMNGWADGS